MQTIMIHAITLGTVPDSIKYSNICFELFQTSPGQESGDEQPRPDYEICTDNKVAYEFITIMVPSQEITSIRRILEF